MLKKPNEILIQPTIEAVTEPKPAFNKKRFLTFLASIPIVLSQFPQVANANKLPNRTPHEVQDVKIANSEINQSPKNIEELIKMSKKNPEMLDDVSIEVKLSEFKVYILYQGNPLKSYKTSIGKANWPNLSGNWSTPTGDFEVKFKNECADPNDPEKRMNSCLISDGVLKYFVAFNYSIGKDKKGEYAKVAGSHQSYRNKPVGKENTHGCLGLNEEGSKNIFLLTKPGTKFIVKP
jgi:L,D-transpeptidase catalytic domain